MYERHFGFSEKPFNLTPDSRYLFLSEKHQEAYANLEFGVQEGSGFLLLTGEVGTGKTTLIRHFLAQVGPDIRTAVILYPALSAGELFHAILQDLGVPFGGGTLKDAVDALAKALIEAKRLRLKVVVLIDEAQNLKPHVLEQLRLLSNLETEREKLITIVLAGQPELRDMLLQPSLRQLSQRITSRSHLEPLSLPQCRSYVRHRLRVAEGTGKEIDDEAVRRVFELSDGVPRVVNILCDRALLGAFGRGHPTVTLPLVEAAAAEVLPPGHRAATAYPRRGLEALGLFIVGLLLILPLRYCPTTSNATMPTPSPVNESPIASGSPEVTAMPVEPGVLMTPENLPSGGPGPVVAVRCGALAQSRAAAIAAIEGFLGTPGFDSAPATLSFEQWHRLKLPAIARFQTPTGPCEAAIQAVDATTTRVSDPTGEYAMENVRLSEAYLGSAIVCFVDRDGVLAKPERARLSWARKVLERGSLVAPGAPERGVVAALARLGERVGLKDASSVEGALLAALYSIDGGSPKRAGVSP
ncbi:MAG: AAA family ATPase [Vicinamibacteria bacterium]|nr:AAA family ATPase [Vicinamibacteria bacterium]